MWSVCRGLGWPTSFWLDDQLVGQFEIVVPFNCESYYGKCTIEPSLGSIGWPGKLAFWEGSFSWGSGCIGKSPGIGNVVYPHCWVWVGRRIATCHRDTPVVLLSNVLPQWALNSPNNNRSRMGFSTRFGRGSNPWRKYLGRHLLYNVGGIQW